MGGQRFWRADYQRRERQRQILWLPAGRNAQGGLKTALYIERAA